MRNPFKNVIRIHDNYEQINLNTWVRSICGYKQIVVLAKGPSAKLLKPEKNCLYVTTNKSYELVAQHHFVNFLSEGSHVYEYIKNGISYPNYQATIFREEVSTGSKAVRDVAKFIYTYKKKYSRNKPEIFLTDLVKDGCSYNNYLELESFINKYLGVKVKQFNSGFGAIHLGFYIALNLMVPLHIYGMDAGYGGLVHYDGTQMRSPSVSSEKVRSRLAILLNALSAQNHILVCNHSFFQPISYKN